MRVAILSCGALVVREKDQSWLFGAPEGVREALDASGIEVPQVVFTTQLRSPGYTKLGAVMRFKELPLTMNGMSAKPIMHKHGTDYEINAGHARLLFSERGDVSAEDVEGYHLAIIRNKHRSDKFSSNVLTWPWANAEYLIQDNVVTPIETQLKVWSSMDDVPENKRSLEDIPLSLEQANFLARVAEASGSDREENWAIAYTQFKKSYKKEDGKWVKKEPKTAEKGMMEKMSQEKANYDVKGGEGIKCCAACEYFCQNLSCYKVEGDINPNGVCSIWEYAMEDELSEDTEMNYPPPMYNESTFAYMGEIDEESFKETKTNSEGRTAADHLVVGDKDKPSTWHLPIGKDGKPDPHLMGGAAAALAAPGGYRGKPYEGEDKDSAISKLISIYNKLKLEVPENLKKAGERLKEFDLLERIKADGGKEDDIISISVDKETGKKYYFNFGDWAEDSTIQAARKAVGEANFDSDAEAPPNEEQYKIVWQYGTRKEYDDEGRHPIPRIADILTAALHKAYNDTSDKLFQVGYLSQDERMKIGQSIGAGLSAFRNEIQNEGFANRAVDKWDADQLMQTSKESWLRIYKSKDDKWRWMSITSVAAWDRQGELFTTKAMDWAIAFSKVLKKLKGDETLGPLRYKHIPGWDGGDCDAQWRIGDALFETGTFRDNKLGLAMRTMLKEDPKLWQMSPGLAFAKNDLVNGVYKRAAIFERSMTQRPANPFTIIITKQDEVDMKVLTEVELKQAMEEVNQYLSDPIEFEEVKTMYERAMAAGSGPLGLKEFTEVVAKATGSNASGYPGGANSTHKRDDEDETDMLKEALDSLDEAELKHLVDLVGETYKEKGKMPPWLQKGGKKDKTDAADDAMEEDDAMEDASGKKKIKSADESRINAIEKALEQQGQLILEQTKAMSMLTQALAGGGRENVEDAVVNMLSQVPRRQANGFVSQTRTKQQQQLPDDDALLQKFEQIMEKQLQNQQVAQGRGLYDQFTSTRLNQAKGGRR